MRYTPWLTTSIVCALAVAGMWALPIAVAQDADLGELRDKIDKRENRIEEIEKEIEKYKDQVQQTSQQKNTLQNRIESLRANQRKLQAEIESAQEKIESKNYTLQKLSSEIQAAEEQLSEHTQAAQEALQNLNQAQAQSTFEALLRYESMSGLWDHMETLESFQSELQTRLAKLRKLKSQLVKKREETRETKEELLGLKDQLSDKNEVLDYNKQQKRRVLERTENQEERYRSILERKRERRKEFLKELRNLESQLQIAIDKSKYPPPGTDVLDGPLPDTAQESCWNGDSSSHDNCVTQYFGNTSFSKRTNAYSGNGHNGVDFRASNGTKVEAAAAGTVRATGNTDSVNGCYSYGKWVLVEHDNGLSTMYAHLSLVKVQEGQKVTNNTLLGYTGNTGYSTGPHLHFTVYATEGVRVHKYEDSNNCQDAVIPIADLDAYLDPFNYM